MSQPKRESRNALVLASFEAYCLEHPEYRFWQALRNWSQQNYILVCPNHPEDWNYENNLTSLQRDLKDTFYWEHRNG